MFKRYPFVKQEGIADCGAASLLMILKYYKGTISITKMRDMTYTDKTGTTAYHLVKAAEALGFSARGYKCEITKLKKIKKPFIAHVIINQSYQHYIVVYNVDFKKNQLIIGDPADKVKKISFAEFNLIWAGIVIELKVKQQLPKYVNENPISMFILFNYIKKEAKIMIPLAFFVTLFSIINTYYFKFIIDGLVDNNKRNFFLLVFICFVFLNLLKITTDYYKNKVLIFIKRKIDCIISQMTFKNIISLPYKYYCSRTTGEIVARINDLNVVKNMIATILFIVFIDMPMMIITAFFLWQLSNSLFQIALLIFTLYIVIMLLFRKIYQKYINEIQIKKAQINSKLVEYISGYETVKGLGIETKIEQRLVNKQNLLLEKIFQFDNIQNVQNNFKNMLSSFGFLIIIYFGSQMVLKTEITIGTLITFNMLLTYFLDPIKDLIELDINYKETKNAFKRVVELFTDEKRVGFYNHQLQDIQINNLSFSYNEYQHIFKGVNLEIKAGEKVLLYGKSGSGKSTILKLLMRFYNVSRDMIIFNNIDINDIKEDVLKNNITYISQKEIIFNDTLFNNLNIVGQKEKVNEMLKICKIDEFIDKKTGLNMMIEENGNNISGGQRQRIVLARSFIKPSQIYLIDEAFSEMDVKLEHDILKNIFNFYPNKTFIIISHRLTNTNLFNKIFKFEAGMIHNV